MPEYLNSSCHVEESSVLLVTTVTTREPRTGPIVQ
jgi:hypothetical protein